jgi:hypothetical protein
MMTAARAIGKCQNQVPYSCANGMYLMHDIYVWNLWYAPTGPDSLRPVRKEDPCQEYAAAGNSVPFFGHFAANEA